jgi:hypothetical protein
MSKRETKSIPDFVCCRDTNIMATRKHVTPTAEKQKKRIKTDEQSTSANTGGYESFSIETGMDLGVAEQVELLEKRVEFLEQERQLMIKEVAKLSKNIKACREEQSHAWECRNKFIGLHNEKLETYIARMQSYTVEKIQGIHNMIAGRQAAINERLDKTEKAWRGCWFVTDKKVDVLWQKEEERKEAEEVAGMQGR